MRKPTHADWCDDKNRPKGNTTNKQAPQNAGLAAYGYFTPNMIDFYSPYSLGKSKSIMSLRINSIFFTTCLLRSIR